MASRKAVPVVPAETPVTPRLLTLRQAADYLNCAFWAIRTMVTTGELKKIPIGRRFCIDRSDLDTWIEQKKRAA